MSIFTKFRTKVTLTPSCQLVRRLIQEHGAEWYIEEANHSDLSSNEIGSTIVSVKDRTRVWLPNRLIIG